ncbi:MAG: hypothetical protein V3W19_00815, partial [Desulfatiglandales bacterium]
AIYWVMRRTTFFAACSPAVADRETEEKITRGKTIFNPLVMLLKTEILWKKHIRFTLHHAY